MVKNSANLLTPAWSFICENVIFDIFTQRLSYIGQFDSADFHDAPEKFKGEKPVLVSLPCNVVFHWHLSADITEQERQKIKPEKATVRFVNADGALLVVEKEIPFVKNKLTKSGYTGVIMLGKFPVLGWGEYTITVTPVGYEDCVHKANLSLVRADSPTSKSKSKKKKKRAARKKSTRK